MPGHETGFHDHDLSSGAVTVVKGSLREERMAWGGGVTARTFGVGDVFDFGAERHPPGRWALRARGRPAAARPPSG